MAAGVNTRCNIGMSRVIYSLPTPAYRNFEVNGQQQYKVITCKPYTYNGTVYAQGATIAYDAGGKYTNPYQLEADFNAGMIDPIN